MARGTPRAFRAFEHPAEDAGVHEARERFLHAVHRVQPGVSRDLMGEPLALYRPIYRAWEARRPAGQGWSMATGRLRRGSALLSRTVWDSTRRPAGFRRTLGGAESVP
jgi:hypothetical protein